MRITIIQTRKPLEQNINLDMQWVGESLGLFSVRDREKSCFRIFVEILKSARKGRSLSTDELAEKTKLTRATVIHHLNNLISKGLVVLVNGSYSLRENTLSNTIKEMKKDMTRSFESIEEVSKDIDSELGIIKKQSHTLD